jgi:Methyltransferase FkbM domain
MNVFLAFLLVTLTVHVTFQLLVASQWRQHANNHQASSSLPSPNSFKTNNDKNNAVVVPVPPPPRLVSTIAGSLRQWQEQQQQQQKQQQQQQQRSGLLRAAATKKAASAGTAPRDRAFGAISEDRSGSGDVVGAPISTLDCASLLREARENRLEFRDPNSGTMPTAYQRQTRPVDEGDEPFWISLHVPKFDPVRWKIMKSGVYYEKTLESIWRHVLKASPPQSRVLDVGANIGYFTLVSMAAAAANGVIVDAFEPNPVNLLRTCESLVLNNWTRTVSMGNNQEDDSSSSSSSPGVHLHPVGVSDTNAILPFVTNRVNPGGSLFVSNLQEVADLVKNTTWHYHHGTNKSVITLDAFAASRGWIGPKAVEPPPHIAILKVDVEALEHKVIIGATRLLQSHLVKNVFMEVSARTDDEVRNGQRAVRVLLEAGYWLQGHGGYAGPGALVRWPQDDPSRLLSLIMDQARANVVQQLNLWWTVP